MGHVKDTEAGPGRGPEGLHVEALCKSFGPVAVLRGVSIVLRRGELTALVGQPGWHAARAVLLEELEHIASLSERLESLA